MKKRIRWKGIALALLTLIVSVGGACVYNNTSQAINIKGKGDVATDIYDVTGNVVTEIPEGWSYLGEMSNEKKPAVKMRVDVNKNAMEFTISIGKAKNENVAEGTTDREISGYSFYFMPFYKCIYLRFGNFKTAAVFDHEFKESFDLEIGVTKNDEVYIYIDNEFVGSWQDPDADYRKIGPYVTAAKYPDGTPSVKLTTLHNTTKIPVEYIVNGEEKSDEEAIIADTRIIEGKTSTISLTENISETYKATINEVLLNGEVLPMLEKSEGNVKYYELQGKANDILTVKLDKKTLSVDEPEKIFDLADAFGVTSSTIPGGVAGGNMIEDGKRYTTNSAFRFKTTLPADGNRFRWGIYSDQPSPYGYSGFVFTLKPNVAIINNMYEDPILEVPNDFIQPGNTYYIESGMVKCYENGNYKYNRIYLKMGKSLDDMKMIAYYDSRERGAYGTTVCFVGLDSKEPFTVSTANDTKTITDVSTQKNKDNLDTYIAFREEQKSLYYPTISATYDDSSAVEKPAEIKLYVKEGKKLTKLMVSGKDVTEQVKTSEDGAYIYVIPKVAQDIQFAYIIE